MIKTYTNTMRCKHCGVEHQRLSPHSRDQGRVFSFICADCEDDLPTVVKVVSDSSKKRCELCKHFGVRHNQQQDPGNKDWKPCGLGHEGDLYEHEEMIRHVVYRSNSCDDFEAS